MAVNKAIFFDRDGVINYDGGYVYRIEDFKFIGGALLNLRKFQELGFKLFIVTNQSGIGRGKYTFEEYHKLTNWYLDELKKSGVNINEVYFCKHSPEDNCKCRKPSPFFLFEASKKYNLDLKNSFMIGDKESDIECGINAGCKTIKIEKNKPLELRRCFQIINLKK